MLVQWTSKLCPFHIKKKFGVQVHFKGEFYCPFQNFTYPEAIFKSAHIHASCILTTNPFCAYMYICSLPCEACVYTQFKQIGKLLRELHVWVIP